MHNPSTTVMASVISASGILTADVTGFYKVRAVCTAFTSGTATVTLALSTNAGQSSIIGTINTVSTVALANLGIPALIPDVGTSLVPVAITATANTATIAPTYGCSYEANIYVSAVTGTNPTMDVVIQESDDSGTNAAAWFDVYHF